MTVTRRITSGWVLAALVVLLPLAYDPAGWQAYLPAKWMVVAFLSVLGLATLRSVPWGSGPVLTWIGFLILAMVVGIDALDPLAHWIGTPERGLGWLAYLFFFLCFLLGLNTAGDDRQLVMRAAVISLTGVGIHGTLQMLGLVGDTADRVTATMGSAAYLGAILCLLLPLAIGSSLDRSEGTVWRITAVLGSVLGLVTALGSQTRAAWVGLAVAAIIVVVVAVQGKRRTIAVAALGAVVIVVALSPVGGRFLELASGDTIGRIQEWETALGVVGTDPLTGVGFEGYRIAFPELVTEEYVREFGREVVTDRAHNGALDVGAATGVLGWAIYAAAMVWVVWLGWRSFRSRQVISIAVGAALIGYVTQQQFLFPLIEVDPIFWALVGMTWSSIRERTSDNTPQIVRWIALPLALLMLATGVLGVVADRQAAAALRVGSAGETEQAVDAVRTARSLRPDSFLFPLVEAEVLLTADDPAAGEAMLAAVDDALALAPRDPILRQRRSEVMLRLSSQGLISPEETWAYYQEVAEEDPNNPAILIGAAQAAEAAGEIESAGTMRRRAQTLTDSESE